ncbi:UDP-N-acetyl-alpha-D-muramoyl-L-alanyl-L-glutamate epimerase [Balamuthia mandrillaris]
MQSDDEEMPMSWFDEDKTNEVEFFSFDGYEIRRKKPQPTQPEQQNQAHELVYRYSFCDFRRFEITLSWPRLLRYLDASNGSAEEEELPLPSQEDDERVERALFDLGLIAMAWPYMGFCTSRIVLRCNNHHDDSNEHVGERKKNRRKKIKLTEEELKFWQNVYRKSLMECFYVNRLDFRQLASFEQEEDEGEEEDEKGEAEEKEQEENVEKNEKRGVEEQKNEVKTKETEKRTVIVPLGGGKDSLVTFELLRQALECTSSASSALSSASSSATETKEEKQEQPSEEAKDDQKDNLTWLFVGERQGEYDENWRLRRIVETSGAKRCIVMEGLCDFYFLPAANQPTKKKEMKENNTKAKTGKKPVMKTVKNNKILNGKEEVLCEWDICSRYNPQCPPWAALIAFASSFVCTLLQQRQRDKKEELDRTYYIAVGNERSANFGNNVFHYGEEINHQWDKSWEFERACHRYFTARSPPSSPLSSSSSSSIYYFSMLQNLWEVDIMREFAQSCQKYVPLFLSCNEPVDGTRWCARCSKCCFVFILMSAFFEPYQVWSVFGDNLFEKKDLLPTFKALMGSSSSPSPSSQAKPFECVGTPEEVRTCLRMAKQKYLLFHHHLPLFFREMLATKEEDFPTWTPLEEQNEATRLEELKRCRSSNDDTLIPEWYYRSS